MVDLAFKNHTTWRLRLSASSAACVPRGFFAFIMSLLVPFTHVDPRVITLHERDNGWTDKKF